MQGVVIGPELTGFLALVTSPQRYLVVLAPGVATLERREAQRAKTGYLHFSPGVVDDACDVEPHLGYWLDSSAQTPAETVEDILDHLESARF